MREYKYRAFDIKNNVMHYDVQYEYDFISGSEISASFGSLLENNEYIVLQYINLNDKNNKPIYEGDLIKNNLSDQVRLVIWNERYGSWGLQYRTGDRTAFYNKEDKAIQWEVVGNKFENSDMWTTNV